MGRHSAVYQPHHNDVEMANYPSKQTVFSLKPSVTICINQVDVSLRNLKTSVEALKELQSRGKEIIGDHEQLAHEARVRRCTETVNKELNGVAIQLKNVYLENMRILEAVKVITDKDDSPTGTTKEEQDQLQADINELDTLAGLNGAKLEHRRQSINQLRNEFNSIKNQVQELEHSYNQDKERIVRAQLEDVLDEQVTDDLVDRVMNVPGALQQIVTEKMTSRGAVVLEDTMSKLQERLAFADQLEKTAVMVCEMVLDMNEKLAMQGEQIKAVADNVTKTRSKLATAVQAVSHATESKKSRFKLQGHAWMTVLGVITLLVLLLAFGVINSMAWNHGGV